MKPISAYVFGTTWRGPLAFGIAYSQRWRSPFHVGFKFLMEDGTQIGFEGSYGKNGFIQFPYLTKAVDYYGAANADVGKTIKELKLPLSHGHIEVLYFKCKEMVATVRRYPRKFRMVWKLLHQRRGWPMMTTPGEVDCSEGVATALYEVGIDLRDKANPNFDSLSPSEVWDKLLFMVHGVK